MNIITILVDFDYTLFDTDKFVKYLQDSPEVINFNDFLFSDVNEFLDYASKFGELTLFSEGDLDFQKAKINGSGIVNLFSGGIKILPSYTKVMELEKIENKENVILIDDKPEVVDKAVSLGIKVIRVKRGKYKEEGTKSSPNLVVNSLSEIVEKDLLKNI